MSDAGDRPALSYSPLRATLVGGLGLAVCVLPMFMVGALGVQLTEELGFGTLGLGAAVVVQRMVSVPSVFFAGRLTDRLGASRALRLGGAFAAVACLGIAIAARSWLTLVVWLLLSGCALALADPAANRLLVRTIPAEKLGNAFGFKQSAPPTATMVAGASVPLVALTFGWRWAYVLAAVAALGLIAAVGKLPPRQEPADRVLSGARLHSRSTIVLLAVALGFGTASSTTVSTFYVTAAVDAGSGVDVAGILLSVASIVTILTRMLSGVFADRLADSHIRLFMVGQATGIVGLLLLASNDPATMAFGVVLALAGTWGLHGVFWFSVVRAFPEAPGAITGAVAPGALAGGAVGPLIFGAIAAGQGNPMAWMVTAGLSVLSIGIAHIGAIRLSAISRG